MIERRGVVRMKDRDLERLDRRVEELSKYLVENIAVIKDRLDRIETLLVELKKGGKE